VVQQEGFEVAASDQDTMRERKIEAARAALAEVRSGMTVGLGTGSTAAEFVRLLGDALRRGELSGIRCTCTSESTEAQAREEGIAVFPLHEVVPIDLAVDGADEIDSSLRMVKGRGAALLREKIVEQQARRFIVIADETKIVERLGRDPFPVEVTPFAQQVLELRFNDMGLEPVLRMKNDQPLRTDEGNVLFDIRIPPARDAGKLAQLRDDLGDVETGFFPTEATEAIIAGTEGIRVMRR
jgi:ribose 5-phosphate isomerase A